VAKSCGRRWEGKKEDGDGGMIFWVKTRLAVAGAPGQQSAVGGELQWSWAVEMG
jgi:hypothetical protein